MGAAIPALTLALAAGTTAYQAVEGESLRKSSKREQDEQRSRQDKAAAKQEELLRTQPKKVAPKPLTDRRSRLRQGLSTTIKTSPRGLTGAPTLSTAALAAGTKDKLGQ